MHLEIDAKLKADRGVKDMVNGVGVSPPIQEGEEYDVTIEDIGKEGDGVAKIENFVVFVPNTKVGDEVTIKITKVLRTLAFGELADGDSEDSSSQDIKEEEEVEEEIETIEL